MNRILKPLIPSIAATDITKAEAPWNFDLLTDLRTM